jgi:hypothetical protein
MPNNENHARKKFITDHWRELTDKQMYAAMLGTPAEAPSEASVTRYRQRLGFIREKEMIYRLRDKK